MSTLISRFTAPLMSCGGSDAAFTTRTTGRHITKSQCLCMIHNARGGLDVEAIPELVALRVSVREDVPPAMILDDYQTVAGVLHADRKLKRGVPDRERQQVHKHYLCDAAQTVLITGPRDLLVDVACHLADPIRPLCIGRLNCVPSRPFVDDPETAILDTDDVEELMRTVPLMMHRDRQAASMIRCFIELTPGMDVPSPTPLIRRIRDVPVGILRDRNFAYREVYTRRILLDGIPEEVN